jgi:hypothetical protein
VEIFDTQHLGWPFVLIPAVAVAAAISLDNRLFGPYFAIVDVVFNDFGSGYSWHDREILFAFVRRVGYVIAMGLLLNAFHYQLVDIAAVFLVSGFLMIWPAFGHPLPVYARKSDWQVLLVWALYVASVVSFGLFGARVWMLIGAFAGQQTWDFIRGNVLWGALMLGLGIFLSAFRAGLQNSLGKRSRRGPKPPPTQPK